MTTQPITSTRDHFSLPHSLFEKKVIRFATETLGFDDCRFTNPFLGAHLDAYRAWLKAGRQGEMEYLKNHLVFKEEPNRLLPGVQSAIVLIKNYKNTSEKKLSQPLKISRYAVGKDYHVVMKEKMEELIKFLRSEQPDIQCYAGVDSRPLAERSLALKAGIGFRGKNTMVIKPGLGSFFFIGAILTTYRFVEHQPLNWNCGQCRLCLDACPTQALSEKDGLNATQCVSYQTIEQKTPMTNAQLSKTKGWLFGCDICQEVCPYNHGNVPLTNWTEFHAERGVGFDIFSHIPEGSQPTISNHTPLYRSRKRLLPNWQKAIKTPSFALEKNDS